MAAVSRSSVGWITMFAWGATVLMSFGCQSAPPPGPSPALGPSPLSDYNGTLAHNARLPLGFYALAGQYERNNEQDHYNGWPRYIVSEKDDMIMAYVPAQTITMGGGLDTDEVPARKVVVNHFYVDIHEVTNAQFNRFYEMAVERRDDSVLPWHPSRPLTPVDADYDGAMGRPWKVSKAYAEYWTPNLSNHHPVRNVSWWEAFGYSKWAGKALPTEAQWEAAARGDDQRIYPWGNEEISETTRYLCNAKTGRENYDGYGYTAPVLSFAAGVSPHGAYNMAGNVWEWCADWYDPGRYAYPSREDPASEVSRGTKAFGDASYPNPRDKVIRDARVGPLRGDTRVMRGGSFADPVERCRVDARGNARPDAHRNNVGFRCVLMLPPQERSVPLEGVAAVGGQDSSNEPRP